MLHPRANGGPDHSYRVLQVRKVLLTLVSFRRASFLTFSQFSIAWQEPAVCFFEAMTWSRIDPPLRRHHQIDHTSTPPTDTSDVALIMCILW